jgi:hypothetical protein
VSISGGAGAAHELTLAAESQASAQGCEMTEHRQNRIPVRPDVCHGKPCVAGTRIMEVVTRWKAYEAYGYSFFSVRRRRLHRALDAGPSA